MKIQIEKLGSFTGHKDCIYTIEPSAVNNQFFSSGSDGLVVQWDLEQPDNGQLAAKIPNTVYALHYLPEKNWLLSGQNFEGIHWIDLATNQEIGSMQLTTAAVFDIKHRDNIAFISMGDGMVQAIDILTKTTQWKQQFSTESARCLAVHPHRPEIAVGYSDSKVRILDIHKGDLLMEIEAHTNSVFTLNYTPDGSYLLSGSRDAHLKIWNAADYTPHSEIVAHLFTINHIAFRPDGKYFATCSKDKSIKLWETKRFKLVKVIDRARHAGHGTSVNKLLWLNENTLLSASDDRSVAAWKVDWGEA